MPLKAAIPELFTPGIPSRTFRISPGPRAFATAFSPRQKREANRLVRLHPHSIQEHIHET
jgi:hypothetical protein